MEPIAIVGMAGRFAGDGDLDAFAADVFAGRSRLRPIPPERGGEVARDLLAPEHGVPDHLVSLQAGLLEPISLGDLADRLLAADLDPALIDRLDPLVALVLRVGADAWDDAALPVDRSRCGAILANIALPTDGASAWAQHVLGNAVAERTGGEGASSEPEPLDRWVTALPVGLLGRLLGFGGPAWSLDAACASSLYAVHLACAELRAGRLDAVIAGGASRPDCLYTSIGFSQLRALSPRGICAPFTADADGLVVGEGAGAFVLMRLGDAVAGGHRIRAVLRGEGLSNDLGGSLLAPDSEGQVRALRAAYAASGIDPATIDLVECHGTGTPRGDAVEVASLAAVWGPTDTRPVIGSVKSNVGHLLTGAGAAGLAKVVLALEAGRLPPSAGLSGATASTSLAHGPLTVLDAAQDWPAPNGRPRRAAVSAFGFGGINAHVIVEEWTPGPVDATPPRTAPAPIAIVGLGAAFGGHAHLDTLGPALLRGEPDLRPRPDARWGGMHDDAWLAESAPELAGPFPGSWVPRIDVPIGRFKLPPNEIPGVLPQHLLALGAVADAVEDAGDAWADGGPRAGCVVGAGLDLETTGFSVRWPLTAEDRDRVGPPLDAARTQGALGGMIASRVARELGLGGPAFLVSSEDASGARALETGVRLLQEGLVDRVVVAAVELVGDLRALLATHRARPWATDGKARPYDAAAAGAVPGEGAAAVVLERLDDARAQGHAVHAVIRGVGSAHAHAGVASAVASAGRRAWEEAEASPSTAGLIDGHGDGHNDSDEVAGLLTLFPGREPSAALSTARAVVGDAGGATSLLSVVRAAMALRDRVLPPLPGFQQAEALTGTALHVPRAPRPWVRDRRDGPRRAAVSALSIDGSAVHVVLEEAPEGLQRPARGLSEDRGVGLFLIEAETADQVAIGLARLADLVTRAPDLGVDALAREWHGSGAGRVVPTNGHPPGRRALVAASRDELRARIGALQASGDLAPRRAITGEVAWVFPGSGNHYVGMGQDLLLAFPDVAEALDAETTGLASELEVAAYAPFRADWSGDWRGAALAGIEQVPERMIFGQVAHGITVARVLEWLGVSPDAILGYSLGESAGLFSSRAWTERARMHRRVLDSTLFREDLAGARRIAAERWDGATDWWVAVLDVPAETVREALAARPDTTADLLIVNAPAECVVGGRRADVEVIADAVSAEARPLFGVPTVHCSLVEPVAREYRELHLLTTTPPDGVRFYSGSWSRAYDLDEDAAADSILSNALHGLDWPATVEAAWDDGVRVFVECGPQASCTRMISETLGDRPHRAVSACRKGRTGPINLYAALADLLEAGVPVDLDRLLAPRESAGSRWLGRPCVTVVPGAGRPAPARPPAADPSPRPHPRPAPAPAGAGLVASSVHAHASLTAAHATAVAHAQWLALAQQQLAAGQQIAHAHQELLTRALTATHAPVATVAPHRAAANVAPPREVPLFDRDLCLEFAVGSIVPTCGPAFAEVDTYPTRVRLPDEPLMLVDRIMSVEGEPGSMSSGRVVTEHDVLPGAWYLDGGRMPVCVSVEAGQADLFLSAWLGVDLQTKGERVYRLLDAEVVFHRDLPAVGETIRYDIRIDRFIRQGNTWMFFFRFEGWIGGEHLITMKDGCAGFFSQAQLEQGKGLVERRGALPDSRRTDRHGAPSARYTPLVPLDDRAGPRTLTAAQVTALRTGDLAVAFGSRFAGRTIHPELRLPSGRMELIHRITELDLHGGRYGLGVVESEWDVDPLGWYLVCHFVDDRVMPGTLMYEGCLHTLRVLLLRLGWGVVGELEPSVDLHHAPIPGIGSRLRCRGQVIETTKTLSYRIDVKEIGYDPEPYVLADAFMVADGRDIVEFENVSYRLHGVTEPMLRAAWGLTPAAEVSAPHAAHGPADGSPFGPPRAGKVPLHDRTRILAYAIGNPSEAFGPQYAPFDHDRILARLPGPPLCFVDRVTEIEPPPWVMAPGGWIEAEYDVPPDAWYFAANGQRSMPFCVILETALQPCGWLAAYVGSGLRSESQLHFRNLDGTATLYGEIGPDIGTITTRVRMTGCSEAGGMILQQFDFQLWGRGRILYAGTTGFGFFPTASLATQVGVRGAGARAWEPDASTPLQTVSVSRAAPLTPQDAAGIAAPPLASGIGAPARAISMLDRIDAWVPDGGSHGLGWIRGVKDVDPSDWFFAAHFYQDPVIPGSLGLEAFLQLLRRVAVDRWGDRPGQWRLQPIAVGAEHRWCYRGQVVPTNSTESVEASIIAIDDDPVSPSLTANGFLRVDGKIIYEMTDFVLRLVPGDRPLETEA